MNLQLLCSVQKFSASSCSAFSSLPSVEITGRWSLERTVRCPMLFGLFPNTDLVTHVGFLLLVKEVSPHLSLKLWSGFRELCNRSFDWYCVTKAEGFIFPTDCLLGLHVLYQHIQTSRPSLLWYSLLCALVQLTTLYVLPGQRWVSHYPPKHQVFHQCVVYNWNCRNVHIINYSKMQVTVQVNCNFSQCDVFIRGFFFLSLWRLAFVWTNLQCHFKTYLSA